MVVEVGTETCPPERRGDVDHPRTFQEDSGVLTITETSDVDGFPDTGRMLGLVRYNTEQWTGPGPIKPEEPTT